MKKNISKQGNQNATMLNQKIGSALDLKTNEDFNNQHPDHNDAGLINANSISGKQISETKNENKAASKTYTCSMHPEVISDKPGKCPKCGMQLIEKQ